MVNSDTDNIAIERVPFLENFPFPGFTLGAGTVQTQVSPNKPFKVITFDYFHGIKTSINFYEKEIWLLDSISNHISSLNSISKLINECLDSDNLIIKRDGLLECEEWTKSFDPTGTAKFQYTTFTDVLNAMMTHSNIKDKEGLLKNIEKLHKKKGIVKLDSDQEKLVICFYQFQLIYFKLILGIVIASKISI